MARKSKALSAEEHQKGAEETKELQVTFADRLGQILDKKIDVIRAGHGRVNDFAEMFKVHYTTAHRLFHGQALPSPLLLKEISRVFDISIDWLLGAEPGKEIDSKLDDSIVKISVFSTRTNQKVPDLLIHISMLPSDIQHSKLLVNETIGVNGNKETLLVKVTKESLDGKLHLLWDPKSDSTFVRRILTLTNTSELVLNTVGTGDMEKINKKDIVFGEPSKENKIHIIGPIVFKLFQDYSF